MTRTRDDERHHTPKRTIDTFKLALIAFMMTCGGPFGIEEVRVHVRARTSAPQRCPLLFFDDDRT